MGVRGGKQGIREMEKWKKEFYSETLIEWGAKRLGKFVDRAKLF